MSSSEEEEEGRCMTEPEANPAQRSGKLCCLCCWCCCCTCSCQSVETDQSGEEPNPTQQEPEEPPETPVPYEVAKEWGDSFEKLMQVKAGRRVFKDFLKCEYSEENILFWVAVEELRTIEDPVLIVQRAKSIYDDFISILSPREVSLDSRVRDIVNQNMLQPTVHAFDEAQQSVYTLMHRDSYPRFLTSRIYKKLLDMYNEPKEGPSTQPKQAVQEPSPEGLSTKQTVTDQVVPNKSALKQPAVQDPKVESTAPDQVDHEEISTYESSSRDEPCDDELESTVI